MRFLFIFCLLILTAPSARAQVSAADSLQYKLDTLYDRAFMKCSNLVVPTDKVTIPPDYIYPNENHEETLDIGWDRNAELLIEKCMEMEGFPIVFTPDRGILPETEQAAKDAYLQAVNRALAKHDAQAKQQKEQQDKIYRYNSGKNTNRIWNSPR